MMSVCQLLTCHHPGNEKISTFQEGYLEADELSDESDEDEVEGSYNFATGEITNVVNGDITQDDEMMMMMSEDEDDEDEDVPISYIGSAPKYPVPQVVFDSEPVQLKSCLSPQTERKKVSFKAQYKLKCGITGIPSLSLPYLSQTLSQRKG